MDSYRTIASRSDGIFKDKGSRFIGVCIPVQDENEIETSLNEIKNQYQDARHHCYAWILEGDPERYRANDDGEPSHSAGNPILNQIKSAGLHNILAVVVRYFGGTKLGVPGLIKAYREATRIALENARIINVQKTISFKIRHSYEATSQVLSALHQLEATIANQEYQEDCIITFKVPLSRAENTQSKLQELEKRKFITQDT